jgi:signal transduction histidine kinase
MFLFVAFSLAIYYISSEYRENRFYLSLSSRALTEGRLYSKDVKEIDTTLLKVIDKNSFQSDQNVVAVYNDSSGKVVYKYPLNLVPPVLTKDWHAKIKSNKEIKLKESANQAMWVYYEGNLENVVVYISGHDRAGYEWLSFLEDILSGACLVAFFVIFVSGFVFSKRMLSPINHIINKVKEINASNLNSRLKAGESNDEIDRLSSTFNEMLNRLEDSFEMKRDFISNASHEFRTPLGILMVQIEVALLNDRTPDEYKKVLTSLLEDIKRLRQLLNGLLELTEANMNSDVLKFQPVCFYELFCNAKSDLLNQFPEYKRIDWNIIVPEDQKKQKVYADELLRTH